MTRPVGVSAVPVQIVEGSTSALRGYSEVSIAFRVESQFNVAAIRRGLGGWTLTEERVEPPYIKDYDESEDDRPARWLERWDTANWRVFSAYDGDRRVGGAVVATRTPGVHMLEGRDDLAVLWDIRVHPEYRRRGIGSELLSAASAWARDNGCKRLKIETQNINVSACRFYARFGCELRAIHRAAYTDTPREVQLLWYLDL